MESKQKEMDSIIQKIYRKIIEIDNKKINKKPTLFIVCSDHGMNEVIHFINL